MKADKIFEEEVQIRQTLSNGTQKILTLANKLELKTRGMTVFHS